MPYDAPMERRRLPWWMVVALSLGGIVVWELLRAAFPAPMQTARDVLWLPALVVLIILVPLGVYRWWQELAAQPTRRP